MYVMRFISTKAHGVLDYLTGILLILLPWLWDYNPTGPESLIPVLLGITAIVISLMTNYERSVLKVIPMKTHLTADILSGILLAASPWIFGFHETVYIPHAAFGIFEILAGLFTKTDPSGKSDTRLI